MAKKTYRINAMVGVSDPSMDRPETKDHYGMTIMAATKGTRFAQPGEPIELDEKEGKALIARFGVYVEPAPDDGIVRVR